MVLTHHGHANISALSLALGAWMSCSRSRCAHSFPIHFNSWRFPAGKQTWCHHRRRILKETQVQLPKKQYVLAPVSVTVPVFASADDDESADDDADERDADSHSDSRHWLLVQVVETIRKDCEASENVRLFRWSPVEKTSSLKDMEWLCQNYVCVSDLWSERSHGRAGDQDQKHDSLVLSAPLCEKTARRPCCWMQRLSQSTSVQASGSPVGPWWCSLSVRFSSSV